MHLGGEIHRIQQALGSSTGFPQTEGVALRIDRVDVGHEALGGVGTHIENAITLGQIGNASLCKTRGIGVAQIEQLVDILHPYLGTGYDYTAIVDIRGPRCSGRWNLVGQGDNGILIESGGNPEHRSLRLEGEVYVWVRVQGKNH